MCNPVVCRLCLYNSHSYYNLYSDKLQQSEIQQKIIKYLYIEIKEDDPYSKIICAKCLDRIEDFHLYFSEVATNQEVLQFAHPINQTPIIITNDKADLIQLSQYSIKTENYIVTLQATNNSTESININDFVPASTATPIVNIALQNIPNEDPQNIELDTVNNIQAVASDIVDQIGDNSVEQVDELLHPNAHSKEIDVNEVKFDTDTVNDNGKEKSNDEQMPPITKKVAHKRTKIKKISKIPQFMKLEELDDADDYESDASMDLEKDKLQDDKFEEDNDNEKFAGFPKVMIKDSKLVIRGKELLNLMSRFFRLECDLCPDTLHKSSKTAFKRLSALYSHYNKVHSMKGYVICCGAKLIKPRAMAMHMSRHLQPEAFTCVSCDKMMTCPKILQYHIQNHLPEEQRPLACPDCPRKFSYSSALIAHSISHQPEHERAVHICDECGKSFLSPGRLSTHMNVAHVSHRQEFICHICAKQFSCRSNLTYHLTTHQPRIHQVQCKQCGKWLKNKLCLRKHMVQHSLVRYSCELCEYSALNRQCLRNHIKVQHSDIKPFSCQYCGKTFKLRNTLLNHMVQHTGIRKFICEFCNRTFASSGNYYSHRKRMHPQELAAVKEKKEEEERLLREEMLEKKFKLEN